MENSEDPAGTKSVRARMTTNHHPFTKQQSVCEDSEDATVKRPLCERSLSDKGQERKERYSTGSSGRGSQPEDGSQDSNNFGSMESGYEGLSRQNSYMSGAMQSVPETPEVGPSGDQLWEIQHQTDGDTLVEGSHKNHNKHEQHGQSYPAEYQNGHDVFADHNVVYNDVGDDQPNVVSELPSQSVDTLPSMENEFPAVQQDSPPQTWDSGTPIASQTPHYVEPSVHSQSYQPEAAAGSAPPETDPLIPAFDDIVHEDSDQEEMNVLTLPPENFRQFYFQTFWEQIQIMQDTGCSAAEIKTFVDDYSKLPNDPHLCQQPIQEVPMSKMEVTGSDRAEDDGVSANVQPQHHSSAADHHTNEMTLQSHDLLKSLQSANQCQRPDCENHLCIIGQDLLKEIDKSLASIRAEWPNYMRQIFEVLHQHGQGCDECACTVPFCTHFHRCAGSFEEALAALHNQYLWSLYNGIESPASYRHMHQLTDRVPDIPLGSHGMPEAGVSYRILTTGRFNPCDRYMVMCASVEPVYMNVHRASHENLSVLSSLRTTHHHIIQHVWAIETARDLLVFQIYSGDTLKAFLRSQYLHGLDLYQTWIVLEHLLQGAVFLQERGVLFMNWISEAFTINPSCAQLTDFSCAITCSDVDEDRLTDTRMLMCPRLIPPELFSGQVMLSRTDAWGAGAVAVEMISGHTVHTDLRHMDPECARDQVLHKPSPQL